MLLLPGPTRWRPTAHTARRQRSLVVLAPEERGYRVCGGGAAKGGTADSCKPPSRSAPWCILT
jgi:hypothetical protein